MNITDEILEMIKQFETIIIHRHQRPDPDAIGSQAGLGEILKTSFPAKKILLAGETTDGLDFLAKMDSVTAKDYDGALAIIVDTADTPRIDGENYDLAKKWIKIDHHPNDQPYGDICYVNTDASSCSEMITDFYLQHQDELSLSDNGALLLYAGIVGDTGRFLYPGTTPETLRMAAALREFSFDAAALNRKLDSVPMKIAKLFGYVFENVTLDEFGAGVLMLDSDVMKKFDVVDAEVSSIVSLPGKIEEAQAWTIFVAQEDGTFRVHFRSKGPVINELAKLHHGGGHPMASGAKAKDVTETEEIYRQLQTIVRDFSTK
ncbi:DHH family phosphoesterase [Enterococcus timonensis]|uniref:DHH family phosphoesterase n=1 Tax=Enterococcus timonensis TaxID=1852364 RepID=UPI0008DB074F|nr:bifunctional oligoribonuclease/PAP phosphatase NrnA [Enterococcus timonensis]